MFKKSALVSLYNCNLDTMSGIVLDVLLNSHQIIPCIVTSYHGNYRNEYNNRFLYKTKNKNQLVIQALRFILKKLLCKDAIFEEAGYWLKFEPEHESDECELFELKERTDWPGLCKFPLDTAKSDA